jgi:eukaryotic-like serine/threonine-protein kinase
MQKGTEFGHYTIESKIGEGGMGEVYLAFDNSLERRVALKILSDEFSQDTERLQRLKQEAKAASSLNHPNIITIYEIGKTQNIEFIAMEFVDGKTLREVIETTNLSTADAVNIAEQIADGLCIAHNAGIVHRDIKPENIMLRNDGYVRILDFGLAKPTKFSNGKTEEETLEMIRTAPGAVMGSVRYMSPEQARGKPIDERSDIWSLGVVLYEMIAGKAPFEGETVSDSLANLIHLEPKPISEIVRHSPDKLNDIVHKSLLKNLAKRYQTVKEMAFDLKELRRNIELNYPAEMSSPNFSIKSGARQLSEETKTLIYRTDESNVKTNKDSAQTKILSQPVFAAAPNHTLRYAVFGLIGLLLFGGIAFVAFKSFVDNKSSLNSFQNPQISLMSDDGKSRVPTISPDGRYIAFQSGEVGARSIMVRQLATGSSVEIVPKSRLRVIAVTFSPDGDYVYYVRETENTNVNALYQVPALGGTSKQLINDVDSGISFAPDAKRFVFIRHSTTKGNDTLILANTDGKEEKAIVDSLQTKYGFLHNPAWSPISDKILLSAGSNTGGETDNSAVVEISTDGNLKVLPNSTWKTISDFHWKKDGQGYFALAAEKEGDPDQVWSISYPTGERRRITNDTNSYNWLGASGDDKTLITVKSDSSSSLWNFSLVSKQLRQLISDDKGASGNSGITQVAGGNLLISRQKGEELNLWEITSEGKDVRQITSDARFNAEPKISPDGAKICFMSNRTKRWRVWIMDIDGKNARQLTVVGDEVNQFSPHFVDQGRKIFYAQEEKNGGLSKLMSVPIEGGTPERVLPESSENELMLYVSPDASSLFITVTGTDFKTFLQMFSLKGDKMTAEQNRFDIGSLSSIKWSPDGKSLTYLNNEGVPNIWQISLDGKDKKQLTNFTSGRIFSFAWSKDGKELFIARGTVNNELILIKDESK